MQLTWNYNYTELQKIEREHFDEIVNNVKEIGRKFYNCSSHNPDYTSICNTYQQNVSDNKLKQAAFNDIMSVLDNYNTNFCNTHNQTHYTGVLTSHLASVLSTNKTTHNQDYNSGVLTTQYATHLSTHKQTVHSTHYTSVLTSQNETHKGTYNVTVDGTQYQQNDGQKFGTHYSSKYSPYFNGECLSYKHAHEQGVLTNYNAQFDSSFVGSDNSLYDQGYEPDTYNTLYDLNP